MNMKLSDDQQKTEAEVQRYELLLRVSFSFSFNNAEVLVMRTRKTLDHVIHGFSN